VALKIVRLLPVFDILLKQSKDAGKAKEFDIHRIFAGEFFWSGYGASVFPGGKPVSCGM
jgi:hypothetical protein